MKLQIYENPADCNDQWSNNWQQNGRKYKIIVLYFMNIPKMRIEKNYAEYEMKSLLNMMILGSSDVWV